VFIKLLIINIAADY